MKTYTTEDGHLKADCSVCERSEHVQILKEDGRCLDCRPVVNKWKCETNCVFCDLCYCTEDQFFEAREDGAGVWNQPQDEDEEFLVADIASQCPTNNIVKVEEL